MKLRLRGSGLVKGSKLTALCHGRHGDKDVTHWPRGTDQFDGFLFFFFQKCDCDCESVTP